MRFIATAVLFLIAVLAAAFFFLRDRDFTFRFSEADLRERLDAQLPWSERYFTIFDVTIDNPRIDLIEGADRFSGGVDARLDIALYDEPFPLQGAVDLSGAVRYARDEGAFYLTDLKVEKVRIAGIPDRFANTANDAISKAIAAFYKSRPIYRLDEATTSHQAARLLLKDVTVKDEHLIVTLALDKSRDGEGESE
ncbi:MAG: DUF1439 domain-containing protein [Pseudomonadota bacterium]